MSQQPWDCPQCSLCRPQKVFPTCVLPFKAASLSLGLQIPSTVPSKRRPTHPLATSLTAVRHSHIRAQTHSLSAAGQARVWSGSFMSAGHIHIPIGPLGAPCRGVSGLPTCSHSSLALFYACAFTALCQARMCTRAHTRSGPLVAAPRVCARLCPLMAAVPRACARPRSTRLMAPCWPCPPPKASTPRALLSWLPESRQLGSTPAVSSAVMYTTFTANSTPILPPAPWPLLHRHLRPCRQVQGCQGHRGAKAAVLATTPVATAATPLTTQASTSARTATPSAAARTDTSSHCHCSLHPKAMTRQCAGRCRQARVQHPRCRSVPAAPRA
jgi:hypothetical protein